MKINDFIKEGLSKELYVDNIFSVASLAKADNDPSCINATVGSLYDEDSNIVTYKTVFNCLKSVEDSKKASYPKASDGNPEFVEAISKFVLEDKIEKPYACVTTAGGTGAIYLAVNLCEKENDTILIPSTSWGNYKTITSERLLNTITYDLYDINDLLNKIDLVKGKLCLMINSPCENPCGHKYTNEQWLTIINKLNSRNDPNILINDIAYIDYADSQDKEYMRLFNKLNENTLTFIAYSLSKTFSFYGVRLGSLFVIHQDEELIKHIKNLLIKSIRTTWSQANNGAMIAISDLLNNHLEEYLKELETNKNMLNQRAKLFIKKADELGLKYYGYSSGFFVTLIVNNEIKDQLHKQLIDKHVYTIKVNNGLRVGLCSVPYNKIERLVDILSKEINHG